MVKELGLPEANLRQTKNDYDYYNNKAVMSEKRDNQVITDKFLDNMRDDRGKLDSKRGLPKDGTTTIISKNQGWITVQKEMDRKKPIEKVSVAGNASRTSYLSPSWMQTEFQGKNAKPGYGKKSIIDQGEKPVRSVFSIGDVRHNVTTAAEAASYIKERGAESQVVRLMEWKEQPTVQRFDHKVAGKIGSYHG